MDKYPKYISQEQQELFERFLLDIMSAKERDSFELSLKKSKDRQESFDEFKSLFETIEEDGLRSKLEDFHNKVVQDKPVIKLKVSKTKFNFRIAAAATILLTLGLWFFNRPSANERVFNKYYTQDPGLPTVMGTNDNYKLYEAMVDYKQGNYAIAIGKWEELLETKPENDTLNYFLGVSKLAIDDEKQAITHLKIAKKTKESIFKNEIYLFLGLAYLKLEKLDSGKEYLELSKDKKAKKILSELNK
ncbi:MAG: tetratricopeptide repeat protein [Maribacter sp.]